MLLGQEPERDHVIVAAMPTAYQRVDALDLLDPSVRFMPNTEDRFTFRANRKAFALPNGGTVIWWDWEPCR